MNFQDLIRLASQHGLLRGEWSDWKRYCDMRARSNDSHDQHLAMAVVEKIPKFLAEATYLRQRLQAHSEPVTGSCSH